MSASISAKILIAVNIPATSTDTVRRYPALRSKP
jgi:hypothetical protein